MSTNLIQRAEKLDRIRSKRISERLTIEEAQNIVSIWGTYLEYSTVLRFMFSTSIPESLLPYPIAIIQGALNKMEALYYKKGLHEAVKLLEETEMLLIQYTDDNEAIGEAISLFSNKKWLEAMIPSFRDLQRNQIQNGFLINKKPWKLSGSRIEDLEK